MVPSYRPRSSIAEGDPAVAVCERDTIRQDVERRFEKFRTIVHRDTPHSMYRLNRTQLDRWLSDIIGTFSDACKAGI
jgi:hypothetical protein